ncbi:hypothetical protein O0L34_g10826 [Tuta absoluta]|nr:hypothetical protein O0L34_g10826 [Tuta absoluta]
MDLYIFCNLIIVIQYYFTFVHSVPAPYCLYPFNGSDCGGAPTPVFHYWKPGSRCEVRYWRGCPTYNRFESETTCSHFCIGRLRSNYGENEPSKNQEPCEGELNTSDCGAQPTTVYTFKKSLKTCLKSQWKGCTTSNKFSDEIQCLESCTFTEKDIGDMDNILDSFTITPKPAAHRVTFRKLHLTRAVTTPEVTVPVTTPEATIPVIPAEDDPVTTEENVPDTTMEVLVSLTTPAVAAPDMTPATKKTTKAHSYDDIYQPGGEISNT